MALIILALAISAIYSGGMYLVLGFMWYRGRSALTADQVENYTFHLGLGFILSVGFLGLLLK